MHLARRKKEIASQLKTIFNRKNAITYRKGLYLEAEKVCTSLLQLLTSVLELKDPYTKGHSQRVCDLSLQLAGHPKVRFPEKKLTVLKYAALLHDIGKVGVSDFVLTKPTLLTASEKSMIQQHTVLGHRLLEPLELDPLIPLVALYRHENYDGTGYPEQLKGNRIPLAARIVKLSDVYEALTSARPYRPAYSKKEALEIMNKYRNEFDPNLFDVFLDTVAGSPSPPPQAQ